MNKSDIARKLLGGGHIINTDYTIYYLNTIVFSAAKERYRDNESE